MKMEMDGEKKRVRRRRKLPADAPKKATKSSSTDFGRQDKKVKRDLTNAKATGLNNKHINNNHAGSIQTGDFNPNKEISRDMRRHERKRQQSNKTISIVVLCVEVLVFCGVLYGLIHFSLKLKNGDFLVEGAAAEQTAATTSAEEGTSSSSINVNNENFGLTCTKVQLTTDVEGNPAALIYFTFVNKTDVPLSLGEVFPPKVVQDGIDCETFAALETAPDELYNKDIQIQDGASIEACYSVKLQNTTSELTLTIHDNYETFTDIASTVIPLS